MAISAREPEAYVPRPVWPPVPDLERVVLYFGLCTGEPGREISVKKVLGIFALLGALVGALMFWRKQQDDDEFLDEELE